MSAKSLLLITLGLISTHTSAYGTWRPYQCKAQCTDIACADPSKFTQCQENCPANLACKIPSKQPPLQPAPQRVQTAQKAQTDISRPQTPPVSGRPLPPTPVLLLKNFTSDLASALQFTECVSKTVAVKPSHFDVSLFKKFKNKLSSNKLSFRDYSTYAEAEANYYASLLNPYLFEQLEKFGKDKIKHEQYPIALLEFMERSITLANNLAIQIPGYTPADSLLKTLPEQTLKDLKICVTNIKFVSNELMTFKNDFIEGKSTKKVGAREKYSLDLGK